MKENFIFDRSLRELFQDIPKTLVKLLVEQDIKEILDISFPKVSERKVDLLTRLEDNTLFHLEIQSINDKNMPIRMLQYASLIYEKYQEFPKQLVLYVGEKKLKIENKIKSKNIQYTYEVKDIREFDCSVLIESEDISDNIIAVLCDIKDIDRFLKRLNQKLKDYPPKRREDYLKKLFYILRLRPKLSDEFEEKTKESKMPFVIDLTTDPIYKKGEKEGLEKGLEVGKLEEKKAIATSLLELHDDKTIADIVGLPIKDIKTLREKL